MLRVRTFSNGDGRSYQAVIGIIEGPDERALAVEAARTLRVNCTHLGDACRSTLKVKRPGIHTGDRVFWVAEVRS